MGEKLTVENRAGEVGQELQEHVFLLSSKFIGPKTLASLIDLRSADALRDVGIEPVVGHHSRV